MSDAISHIRALRKKSSFHEKQGVLVVCEVSLVYFLVGLIFVPEAKYPYPHIEVQLFLFV
jgi:hypothetical protein